MSIDHPDTPDTTDTLALTKEAHKEKLREQLRKGQERMAQLRAEGWKPVHRNPVEQANAKPNSLKAAIKAFCWVCVGADADPGAKFRVRDCAVGPKCSLFPHRPWQTTKGGLVEGADGALVATETSEIDEEDDSNA